MDISRCYNESSFHNIDNITINILHCSESISVIVLTIIIVTVMLTLVTVVALVVMFEMLDK